MGFYLKKPHHITSNYDYHLSYDVEFLGLLKSCCLAQKIKTYSKEKKLCSLQALYNFKSVLNMSIKCIFYRGGSTAAAATSAPSLINAD